MSMTIVDVMLFLCKSSKVKQNEALLKNPLPECRLKAKNNVVPYVICVGERNENNLNKLTE